MKQLASNVYAEDRNGIPSNFRGANTGFVVTDDGVVMIDTPMFPTDAVELRDRVAEEGDVRYVINTDFHEDHTTGNYFFDGDVVAHRQTKRMLDAPPTKTLRRIVEELVDEDLPSGASKTELTRLRLEQRNPDGVSLLDEDFHFRSPTITFTDELRLSIGGVTFELRHLPGHTRGHIGVYLPDEKVLFAGDNVTNGYYPSLIEAVPRQWIQTLKTIESMEVETIVPGHGAVCGKEETREFREFLADHVEKMNEVIDWGLTQEEAIDEFSLEGLPAMHPDPEFHRMNVTRLYEKLFYG